MTTAVNPSSGVRRIESIMLMISPVPLRLFRLVGRENGTSGTDRSSQRARRYRLQVYARAGAAPSRQQCSASHGRESVSAPAHGRGLTMNFQVTIDHRA